MKSISSAIVVLAGIYGLTTTIPLVTMQPSFFPFLGLTAGAVTLYMGLLGWWTSIKYDR